MNCVLKTAALLLVLGASSSAQGQPVSPYDVGASTSLHARWSGKAPGTFVLFHNVVKTAKGQKGKPSLIGYQLESTNGGKVILRRKEAKHESGKYVARPYSKVEVPRAKGNLPKPSKTSNVTLQVWGKPYSCRVKEWEVGGSLTSLKIQNLLSPSKPGLHVAADLRDRCRSWRGPANPVDHRHWRGCCHDNGDDGAPWTAGSFSRWFDSARIRVYRLLSFRVGRHQRLSRLFMQQRHH